MGDTIMVRSLAPLPRLEEVTFLRPDARAFVTGEGPFPYVTPRWVSRLMLIMAGGFAIVGLGFVAVAEDPVLFLGHPLAPADDWIGIFGLAMFGVAVLDVGISIFLRKLWAREAHLASDGGLLPAELLSARVRAAKGGNNLQVQCRFTSPEGTAITATKNVGRPDRRLRTAPPPDVKILILYGSDRLWQIL
jgi:hypothetical protein